MEDRTGQGRLGLAGSAVPALALRRNVADGRRPERVTSFGGVSNKAPGGGRPIFRGAIPSPTIAARCQGRAAAGAASSAAETLAQTAGGSTGREASQGRSSRLICSARAAQQGRPAICSAGPPEVVPP
ncbi:MAG TPA: hypothetical protein VKP69_33560, partial [Isosphaeraceae bacterium]|nr:hypothetical protein [Isosphaeraceae bacterium]